LDATDLAFAGIAEQARLIAAGEISSRELVDVYLERIERIDLHLNSFREIYGDEARAAAAAADEQVAAGDTAPLLGVPVAFKDELDITGRVTRHGTDAYDEPARGNAAHVQRLIDAGAIVLGKTNLPELAICGFTETEATGDTRNPWDTSRTPGGSSGGSGAAVAAGLVGAASASDGAGSIRIPGALNGLVGLMPQRGRISLMPETEHWNGMSRTGCLTRRVVDTALWMDVAAGPQPDDAHTPPPFEGSWLEAATTPPTPLRIATSVTPARAILPPIVDDEVKEAVATASDVLAGLGHSVIERTPDYKLVGNDMVPLYLGGIANHYAEVPHPERLEKRTRGFARLGRAIPDRMVQRARRREVEHSARINAIFDDVDLLVTPCTGTLPVEVGRWRGMGATRTLLSMSRVYAFTATWNYTGQPAMAVPVGLGTEGLPRSVMLIAPPNREDLLLAVAQQMETAIAWPESRPPVE
jgi:amidase